MKSFHLLRRLYLMGKQSWCKGRAGEQQKQVRECVASPESKHCCFYGGEKGIYQAPQCGPPSGSVLGWGLPPQEVREGSRQAAASQVGMITVPHGRACRRAWAAQGHHPGRTTACCLLSCQKTGPVLGPCTPHLQQDNWSLRNRTCCPNACLCPGEAQDLRHWPALLLDQLLQWGLQPLRPHQE